MFFQEGADGDAGVLPPTSTMTLIETLEEENIMCSLEQLSQQVVSIKINIAMSDPAAAWLKKVEQSWWF